MSVLPELLAANQSYAAFFHRRDLPIRPRLRLALLVCMDSRIDPGKVLGIREGDAHVIRNAGGRAADALRSLAISCEVLGVHEIVVIHHTECGMMTFSNDDIRQKLGADVGPEASEAAGQIDFLPFTDLDKSVQDDVAMIKSSPLVPSDVSITGFIYDLQTGRLRQVA
jgi:carbonic anhydrase